MFCQAIVVWSRTFPRASVALKARWTSSIGLSVFTLILYEMFALSAVIPPYVNSTRPRLVETPLFASFQPLMELIGRLRPVVCPSTPTCYCTRR